MEPLRNSPGVRTVRGAALALARTRPADAPSPFKLLFVQQGRSEVAQGGRRAQLSAGEFTLIDGTTPFSVLADEAFVHLLVALPRETVVARYRGIDRRTALVHGGSPDDGLLRNLAAGWAAAQEQGELAPATQHAAAGAVITLLQALSPAAPAPDHAALLRQRALALIDLHVATIDAEQLAAQLRVSRRHLDATFASGGGTAAQAIWERRLVLAAERLQGHGAPPITDVAHALGFQDASHFARRFRQRFGSTPTAWRRAGTAGGLVRPQPR
ncbi:helix-turn-helix domain-containing protein [Aquabacterium humicola]|uniref:helix-turn-helix domain-containing protein n=1 Tax=Aquabacterium humicola TaxID=3237377 RepID=UPI0025431DFE|nr:helix-turn-helix domain-containing protein [Rubrivivax pictus]